VLKVVLNDDFVVIERVSLHRINGLRSKGFEREVFDESTLTMLKRLDEQSGHGDGRRCWRSYAKRLGFEFSPLISESLMLGSSLRQGRFQDKV
jgi:hypothetical protein